jgi:hypothetical protein
MNNCSNANQYVMIQYTYTTIFHIYLDTNKINLNLNSEKREEASRNGGHHMARDFMIGKVNLY